MTNNFKELTDLGYGDALIPVKRGGKAVISSIPDWPRYKASEEEIEEWGHALYSVGLRTANFPTLDVDTDDLILIDEIHDLLAHTDYACRARSSPNVARRALVFAGGGFKKFRVEGKNISLDADAAVEFLCDGQQVVLLGQHPDGDQYTFDFEPASALTVFDEAGAASLMKDIELLFEDNGYIITSKPIAEVMSGRQGTGTGITSKLTDEEFSVAMSAARNIPNDDRHWDDWVRIGLAIRACAGTDAKRILEAEDAWREFSAKASKYDPVITEDKWDHDFDLNYTGQVGDRTLIYEAEQGGNWERPKADPKKQFSLEGVDSAWDVITSLGGSGKPQSLLNKTTSAGNDTGVKVIHFPSLWAGKTAPPRRWLLEGWIPENKVGLLSSVGGLGKSLLCQQLASTRALSQSFLGLNTTAGRTLMVSCEDDLPELHVRQEGINTHLMTSMKVLDKEIGFLDRTGSLSNPLCLFDRDGNVKLTGAYETVRDGAKSMGADLIVLDTVADMFAGDENARAHVNGFMKACLGTLARETGATILVLAHPSKASMSADAGRGAIGYSGSTAWPAASRFHLYFREPTPEEAIAGTSMRVLTKTKINAGPLDGSLMVDWVAPGYFKLVGGTALMNTAGYAVEIERMINAGLGMATIAGIACRADKRGGVWLPDYVLDNVAPEPAAKIPSELITKKAVQDVLKKMMADGKIVSEDVRFNGKIRNCLVFS